MKEKDMYSLKEANRSNMRPSTKQTSNKRTEVSHKDKWDKNNSRKAEKYGRTDEEYSYSDGSGDDGIDVNEPNMERLRLPKVKKNGQRELITESSNISEEEAGYDNSDEHSDSERTQLTERVERTVPRRKVDRQRKHEILTPDQSYASTPRSHRRVKNIEHSDRAKYAETKHYANTGKIIDSPKRSMKPNDLTEKKQREEEETRRKLAKQSETKPETVSLR